MLSADPAWAFFLQSYNPDLDTHPISIASTFIIPAKHLKNIFFDPEPTSFQQTPNQVPDCELQNTFFVQTPTRIRVQTANFRPVFVFFFEIIKLTILSQKFAIKSILENIQKSFLLTQYQQAAAYGCINYSKEFAQCRYGLIS